jgi:RNA polymerase sigma factor (sigma-70 family)
MRGGEPIDEKKLVEMARSGDSASLEKLLRAHRPWVFKTVMRVISNPDDAEDLCQDILVKATAKLPSFEGRCSFRTWLYRIALNRALDAKEAHRGRESERFDTGSGDEIDGEFRQEPPDLREPTPEDRMAERETGVKFMMGMLLCLDRRDRSVFVLGEVLDLGGKIAADILDMTEVAFRKALSRARNRLRNYMRDRCALVDPRHPCSCARSRGEAHEPIYPVDPEGTVRMRATLVRAKESLDYFAYESCRDLMREMPNYDSSDFTQKMREMMNSEEANRFLEIEKANDKNPRRW